MRIHPLSPALANQIAAGEVIERPASVVKELLDNALDAGASHVNIEIGFGGLNQIKISDNGQGICAEDMHLAIAAHATSKISQLTDLYQITSMGFRGEALASIASVSRLTLHSKPADQLHGMVLSVDESGAILRPSARTQGTTVDVQDLFFNTPVRKTFLKTERIEYQAIELMVRQCALAAPMLSVCLKHNGKIMLNLPAANCPDTRLRRIKKLFGQAFLADAIYIDEREGYLGIEGWVSQRDYQRSQRDKQWTYLNQRFIKDKVIQQAIGQAYQGILHPGRYASCLFYLSIAPEQVDVNVHPAKQEVRFRDPRLVHAMIVSAISKSLQHSQVETFLPQEIAALSFLEDKPPQADTTAVKGWIGMPEWRIVNPDFVLIEMPNRENYLVNIHRVYELYLSEDVRRNDGTLPSRPLLVPIRCPIPLSAYALFEHYKTALLPLGIQFDFLSETCLMIRSIPLGLPLLDLERFFAAIQPNALDYDRLLQQAIACQSFDAYNMSSVEWEGLLYYYLQHWQTSAPVQACGVRLDNTTCQQIMMNKHIYD